MTRRYANETAVPIARSRGEIDKLLRQWGADAIQWTDEFSQNRTVLRFRWSHEGAEYGARITLELPGESDIDEHAIDLRTGRRSKVKFEKLMAARGKREHRVLLLFLKAAFNAIEAVPLAFAAGWDAGVKAERERMAVQLEAMARATSPRGADGL